MRYFKGQKTLLNTEVNKELEAKRRKVMRETLRPDFEDVGSDT